MLTADDYLHVLLGRQAAATIEDRWPPLLEWMVRPGDERLFTPPAPSRTALSERKPRRYRPASYWRIRLERTDARLAVLTAEPTERPDMAAYGGVGIRETHRQRERRWSRLDRDLAEHTRLTVERDHYARMLQAAERREASWERVVQPSVYRAGTGGDGGRAIFLDPPYATSGDLYAHTDGHETSAEVRDWCTSPAARDLNIVLCGYDDEHDALLKSGWTVTSGRAGSGAGYSTNAANGRRERLWLSPGLGTAQDALDFGDAS